MTDNAAIDDDTQTGAQCRFDIPYNLFRVKFRARQDVNFCEPAGFIGDRTGRDDAAQCCEQPLGTNFNRGDSHFAI